MKSHIKKLTPGVLIDFYRRLKRFVEQRRNLGKTPEEVFSDIYERNKWGGSQGEFCSGGGSSDERVVSVYVETIFNKASSENFLGLSFIDLGCGDFRVGKRLLPICSSYTGIDVVQPLIQNNQKRYGSNTVNFMNLDIVKDELPDGEVCFIRQVLQHLSNQQIVAILPKLEKYKWVFITEHYPTDNDSIQPNMDKICGADIRAYGNSGVYLEEPPFNVPAKTLEQVLEVQGTGIGEGLDPGVIRTFLFKPGGRHS